ncbi:hypothetical protein [Archangium primigenium]|uniref:hypothetical protein n=1 Tax=[Archangium] primigenium TaxID=2792470 RepID=UPI00195E7D50|nr:hypothetical protein [Archangium primigenium]MBM7117459.1 hypothetical protein [Archangium primigenium]
MSRVLPVLLLSLAACSKPGAVQALITVDPQVQASCIALEVRSTTDDTLLKEERVPVATLQGKDKDQDKANIAVFQGALPKDVRLQARALWGADGCTGTLLYNGKSAPVAANFSSADIVTVPVTLSPPGPDEDSDRDGFVAAAQGGPDCDDDSDKANPKAQQETCDASADLNCDGKRGCDDNTCSAVSTCSRVATSIAFATAPMNPGVGQCVEVSVVRRDAKGAPTAPNYATGVTPTTSAPDGVSFHQNSDCQTPALTTFTIEPKQSSVRFYVKGVKIGANQLRADAEDFQRTVVPYNLRAGDASQVAFASEAQSIQAGSCVALILERRDVYGNPTENGPLKTIRLTPTPANAKTAFYSSAGCADNTRLPAPTAGTQSADFNTQTSLVLYFRSELATTFTLEVKDIGTAVTRAQEVTAAPASNIELTLTPPDTGKSLLAGECSKVAVVRTTDAFGNAISPVSGLVTVSAPLETGIGFYTDAACGTAVLAGGNVTSAGGTASFYFKSKTGGQPADITASVDGRTSVKSVTITPTVRRGPCDISGGQNSSDCAITPKLNSRGKSFLVFQATSTETDPRHTSVRCRLNGDDRVQCFRKDNNPKPIQVQWQVVEMPSGLRAQQFETSCTSNVIAPITLTTPVTDATRAFVLYSSTTGGNVLSANDFVTVQLTGTNRVDLAVDPAQGCNNDALYTVQVVEFDGSKVTRGLIPGPTEDSTFSVGDVFTPEEAGRSALLATFRTSVGDDTANLCNRTLRGSIDAAASQLRFSRSYDTFCPTPALTGVSWERIQFPTGTVVQAVAPVALDGALTTKATLATAVDTSRTLLLAGTQAHNGQSSGETSHKATAKSGVVTGRLVFTSPTEVEVRRDLSTGPAQWSVYAIQLNP